MQLLYPCGSGVFKLMFSVADHFFPELGEHCFIGLRVPIPHSIPCTIQCEHPAFFAILQLSFELLASGNIVNERTELIAIRRFDRRNGQLDGEFVSVTMQCNNFYSSIERKYLSGGQKMPHAANMRLAIV